MNIVMEHAHQKDIKMEKANGECTTILIDKHKWQHMMGMEWTECHLVISIIEVITNTSYFEFY